MVSWSSLPLECVSANDVLALQAYLDCGAPVLPDNRAVADKQHAQHKDKTHNSGTAKATTDAGTAPLEDEDWLLIDTGASATTPPSHAQSIVARISASFAEPVSVLGEQAEAYTRRGTQAYLALLNRRAVVMHTSLQALRTLQANIFKQQKRTLKKDHGPSKTRRGSISGGEAAPSALSLFAPATSASALPAGLASSVVSSSSGASPTLRMLVHSFFPLLSLLSTQAAPLKQAVMSSLLSVLSTLPTLGLKAEPTDCITQFRQLVQEETHTAANITSMDSNDEAMPQLNLCNGSSSSAGPSHSPSALSSASQELALSTLMGLALQQGSLEHILQAIGSCLQAAAATQPAVQKLSSAALPSPLPSDARLSVDVFLHQLQNYRVSESLPQLSSATFLGGWQHHSAAMHIKAPPARHIDNPTMRADSAAATAVVQQQAGSGDASELPFLGSIATCGTFYYLYSQTGLLKVGSGYNGSIAQHVYAANSNFPPAKPKVEAKEDAKNEASSVPAAPAAVPPARTKSSHSKPTRTPSSMAAAVAAAVAAGEGDDMKSGALVWASNRLFFARPNFQALVAFMSPSSSSSSSSLSAAAPPSEPRSTVPLLREIDPISLEVMGEVEIVYKPSIERQRTGADKKKAHTDSSSTSLPFYLSVTSDSTHLYGLYMDLAGLRKHRSSSSSSRGHGATSTVTPNTLGFAHLVDVFSVNPTRRQVTFLRTIVLEDTDGPQSKYAGLDRTLLPSSLSASQLGLQTLPCNLTVSTPSSSYGGDPVVSQTGLILLPYKCAIVGGGSLPSGEPHEGYLLRAPALPRLASTQLTPMSFKPDVFDLSGKCLARGGWEQRSYENPASTLQMYGCSPVSAVVPAARGTALCYDARNDVIVDYSPLSMQIMQWSNPSCCRHAAAEEYFQQRVRGSALADSRLGTETGSLRLLPVCAAVMHHLARLSKTHEPTPAQLSLSGLGASRYVVPLSPFTNAAVPVVSSPSLAISPHTGSGVLAGVPRTQAMCVQPSSATFSLLHDIAWVLLQSLLSLAPAVQQLEADAVFHMLCTALKVLSVNLSLLAPPPVQKLEVSASTLPTATNSPQLSSAPTPAVSIELDAILSPALCQRLKQLLQQLLQVQLPSAVFPEHATASAELRSQSLSALLSGLSHFYPSPADVFALVLSPLGSDPLVVRSLVQYPRLCLTLSASRVESEVMRENGVVAVLIRRVMQETRDRMPQGNGEQTAVPVASEAAADANSLLLQTPSMQLLSFFHRTLLSRIHSQSSEDAPVRTAAFHYCRVVVSSSVEILRAANRMPAFTSHVDAAVQASIAGVLLPSVMTLLVRISSPSTAPSAAAFALTADSLIGLLGSVSAVSTSQTAASLIDLQHELHVYHSREIASEQKAVGTAAKDPLPLLELDRATQVLESSHPYVSVDSRTTAHSLASVGAPPFVPLRMPAAAYSFPGADYLVLTFDPRCSTGSRNDILTIQSLDGRKLINGSIGIPSALHPHPSTASAGQTIELSLNSFPRTPVVVAGSALQFSFAPEGTIRERERGTAVSLPHASNSSKKSILYWGFKVTVHGLVLRPSTLVSKPTGESINKQRPHSLRSMPWSLDLLHSVALLVGHCAQLAIFQAPPAAPAPAGVSVSESKREERQLAEVRSLLRTDLFAGGHRVPSVVASASCSTVPSPSVPPFLRVLLSNVSPASELVEWLNRLVKGRPMMSGVARKAVVPVERALIAALLHNTGLVEAAAAIAEEVQSAGQQSAQANGSTAGGSALPPPSFTPAHPSLPQLQQVWSTLYQLLNSFLNLARSEKRFLDICCLATPEAREAEVKALEPKQRNDLLALKQLFSDPAEFQSLTAAAAVPASASASAAAAAASSASVHEAKLAQFVQSLVAQVESERAKYLSQQAATNNNPTDAGERKHETTPAVELSLDWDTAYSSVAAPLIARATFALELHAPVVQSASSVLFVKSVSTGLMPRSVSAVVLPTEAEGSSAGSSPRHATALAMTRSFTDVRTASVGGSDAPESHLSDSLPLARSNSLSRSTSSIQRQLLASSASSKHLPSVGREVANARAGDTPVGSAEDTHLALKRWQSWRKAGGTPHQRGSFSAKSDPAAGVTQRLQLLVRFLSSNVTAQTLTNEMLARRAEAQRRAQGLLLLNRALCSVWTERDAAASSVVSSTSLNLLNDLLIGLGSCIRQRWSCSEAAAAGSSLSVHYLSNLEGAGEDLCAQVRSAFSQLLCTFSSMLSVPSARLHSSTQMLLLDCCALAYRAIDIELLTQSKLLHSIYSVMATPKATVEATTKAETTSSVASVACARYLFCQLATLVLLLPSDESDALKGLQQQVMQSLFAAITHTVERAQKEAATAAAVSKSLGESPSSSTESALYSLLLLLHALRRAPAVRHFLSQPPSLQGMLRILHMSVDDASAGLMAPVETTAPPSLRTQRLLLRLLRGMLTSSSAQVNSLLRADKSSSDTSSDGKQRVFVVALFDRLGSLLSGEVTDGAQERVVELPAAIHAAATSSLVTVAANLAASDCVSVSGASSSSSSHSAVPAVPVVVDSNSSSSVYSLSVVNADPESLSGSQFAAHLYAACKDILKAIVKPAAAAQGQGQPAVASNKGDWRMQLSSGNTAVLMQGTRDDCTRIGRMIAGRGYVCTLAALPPSDGMLRNQSLSSSNPSFFLSGAVALTLAAEHVALLQALLSNGLWHRKVEEEMASRIRMLRTLASSSNTSPAAMASALSALAVLAGVRDELRAGARVSVLQLDREDDTGSAVDESDEAVAVTATVLRVEAGRSQATIAVDPADGSAPSEASVMSVSRLRPLVGSSSLHLDLIGDVSLMDTIVHFLSHALSGHSQPSTSSEYWLLEQELSLYALRFLSSVLTDARHAAALLPRTDLLSLLITCAKRCPASSSGLHASASHLAQLERQSSRLRLRWLDLRRPPRWPRNRMDQAAQEQARKQADASAATTEHGLAAILPHQPCAQAAKSSLPTTVSFSLPAPSKYLLFETSKSGPPVVHFTRDVQVHIPADFLARLGQQRSSGSMRRLEEQLRVEAAGMGVSGESDWCILADAPIDLTITEYYFEVTLLSAHPVSVGLTPKPPTPNAAGPSAAEQEAAEVAAHGGRGDRRQDAGALLQAKLQQVLRARMHPWAVQSVRLQSKDGRVVRKLVESAGVVAGRDEVKAYTEAWGAEGDVIGVHWSLIDGAITFTKNGKSLGVACSIGAGGASGSSSSGPASSPSSGSSRSSPALHKMYPAVSCTTPGTKVSFNFGASPFVYSLPAQSSVVESDAARADRLRRAEEADRAALQREEQERTRREVERVSLEVSRNEMAQSIQDLGGLPSRRHALMALSMHRWDAGQVANWSDARQTTRQSETRPKRMRGSMAVC